MFWKYWKLNSVRWSTFVKDEMNTEETVSCDGDQEAEAGGRNTSESKVDNEIGPPLISSEGKVCRVIL